MIDARAAERAKPVCPHCGQPQRPKRRPATDNEKYRRAVSGMIVNYTKRIADGGVEVLADVVALRDTLNNVIDAGVADCRSFRWMASWGEIGAATNMSRQGAEQRWGSLGGERRPGGQPSSLR